MVWAERDDVTAGQSGRWRALAALWRFALNDLLEIDRAPGLGVLFLQLAMDLDLSSAARVAAACKLTCMASEPPRQNPLCCSSLTRRKSRLQFSSPSEQYGT